MPCKFILLGNGRAINNRLYNFRIPRLSVPKLINCIPTLPQSYSSHVLAKIQMFDILPHTKFRDIAERHFRWKILIFFTCVFAISPAIKAQFAIAFVGSSGAGGTKILRRNYGEQAENLASSGEYHWFVWAAFMHVRCMNS